MEVDWAGALLIGGLAGIVLYVGYKWGQTEVFNWLRMAGVEVEEFADGRVKIHLDRPTSLLRAQVEEQQDAAAQQENRQGDLLQALPDPGKRVVRTSARARARARADSSQSIGKTEPKA